jgi:tetratricopeptide (TPR) repeat protein
MPSKPEIFPPGKTSRSTLLAGGVIVLLALVVYWESFSVPFIFDDGPAISINPTIRHLWPLWGPLSPPVDGSGVTGRPLVNLSLAINYAFGGTSVRGYHLLNLSFHMLAGLTLFGLVRRTLLLPKLRQHWGSGARPIALMVAALWTIHPLQTESVICIVQRTELLVGLFYLFTLYCFVRGVEATAPNIWFGCSVVACLLGMASKELMVTAPVIVLLYDRTFVSGDFRTAWRQHRGLWLGLAATWVLLAFLVIRMGGTRGSAAGLGLGIPWWAYSLKQCQAIVHYLQLAIWPHPLVLDYGASVIYRLGEVGPQALLLLALVVGTLVALRRWPMIGFLGAWFFVILAPSSSVVPLVAQTVAEHRMYLPLAALVTLAVTTLYLTLGRRSLLVGLALTLGLGYATVRRGGDYRSDLSIWQDTVAKQPGNARAHTELGIALNRLNRKREALAQYQEAVRIDPTYALAQSNLGEALIQEKQFAAAIQHCEAALRSKPDFVQAHTNLAAALLSTNRVAEAQAHCEAALRLNPEFVAALSNLARAQLRNGRVAGAIASCEQALRLQPDAFEALAVYGDALARSGREREAIPRYEAALRLRPDSAEIHGKLASALTGCGRIAEAIPHYETALRLQADSAEIQSNFGSALYQTGRVEEAINHYQSALRLQPNYPEGHNNLASALFQAGRLPEAILQYNEALRLKPDYTEAHCNLGLALAQLGRTQEAIRQFEEALRLEPNYAPAHDNLSRLRAYLQKNPP